MNNLEMNFLALLSQKLAKDDTLIKDYASIAVLMGAAKQTPEDWIRLAEGSIDKVSATLQENPE